MSLLNCSLVLLRTWNASCRWAMGSGRVGDSKYLRPRLLSETTWLICVPVNHRNWGEVFQRQ